MSIEIMRVLKRQAIFAGLTDEDLRHIAEYATPVEMEAGDLIIREGEMPKHFYLLLEGETSVVKSHGNRYQHEIASMKAGDPIGELGFIENIPRSASIYATMPSKLLSFNIKDFHNRPELSCCVPTIIHNLSKRIAGRLRHTNEVIIGALNAKLEQVKKQVFLGTFLIYTFTIMCGYILLLDNLIDLASQSASTTYVSAGFIICVALMYLLLMLRSGYPLSTFGITFKGAKHAVIESVLVIIPFLILLVFIKLYLISQYPQFAHMPLFDPKSVMREGTFTWTGYWIAIFAYILFTPFQEIITRGALQSSLQGLLVGKRSRVKWTAILMSNLIFAAAHAHLKLLLSLISFIPGLLWGWLYDRHKTIVGVSVSHALLGVFAFFMLGVAPFIR